MKKIKIMLTAITVMSVVGAALAFKAKKLNTIAYCTTQAAPGACTIPKYGFSVDPAPDQPSVGSYSCLKNEDCALRPTYAND